MPKRTSKLVITTRSDAGIFRVPAERVFGWDNLALWSAGVAWEGRHLASRTFKAFEGNGQEHQYLIVMIGLGDGISPSPFAVSQEISEAITFDREKHPDDYLPF